MPSIDEQIKQKKETIATLEYYMDGLADELRHAQNRYDTVDTTLRQAKEDLRSLRELT